MNLTYAVPDLHGADTLLERALTAIGNHAAGLSGGERLVVFLGDYVDRGPGSRQIIERLMAGPPRGWRWVCLKGNHEDMMLSVWSGESHIDWWLGNGGDTTLLSYGFDEPADSVRLLPEAHMAWVRDLPPLVVDRHRVFVHAGVDPTIPLDQQPVHDLLWTRSPSRLGHDGRFVVHGHTPHPDGPVRDGQSLNLDTYAWRTGRLVVGVFDGDREGGPIDLIEVRG